MDKHKEKLNKKNTKEDNKLKKRILGIAKGIGKIVSGAIKISLLSFSVLFTAGTIIQSQEELPPATTEKDNKDDNKDGSARNPGLSVVFDDPNDRKIFEGENNAEAGKKDPEGIEKIIDQLYIKYFENSENNEEDTNELNYESFKEKINKQLKNGIVDLNKADDKYVNSLYIEGKKITIRLCNGEKISGKKNRKIILSNLNLENLYIIDEKSISEENTDRNNIVEEEDNKIEIILDSFQQITVNNKLKIAMSVYSDIQISSSWEYYINLKNCNSIWIEDRVRLDDMFLNYINSAKNLERLYIINPIGFSLTNGLKLELPKLKDLYIEDRGFLLSFGSYQFYLSSIDISDCKNLETFVLSGSSAVNEISFKSLSNLKSVAFSGIGLLEEDGKQMSFNQKLEDSINSTDVAPGKAYDDGIFIRDLTSLEGNKNLEEINISLLENITSEDFLRLVKSCPNLKKIIGQEINNAYMCSNELVDYCEENKIEHPFTEKSLQIKNKLIKIVKNVTNDNMNEMEKIKALSKYEMNHLKYYDVDNEKDKDKAKKIAWSERLYYAAIEGIALCDGYTLYAHALFLEAGIKSYGLCSLDHAYNLVKVNGEYFLIDLTNLDAMLEIFSKSDSQEIWKLCFKQVNELDELLYFNSYNT